MERAFRELAEEYRDKVYTFALYSLRRPEEAEDVTQEVLIRLWQNREHIDSDRVGAWVMRVARNLVIDVSRRRKTRTAVIAEEVPLEVAGNLPGGAVAPDDGAEAREFRDALEEALARVGEPYRSIVVMREIQELRYVEIAETLDMPLNTVKAYLHRGRAMLRDALKEKYKK